VSHPDAVWITGAGAATSLGCTPGAFAENLLAGRNGVERVQRFDVTDHPCQIAAMVHSVPCPPGCDAVEFASLPRLEQLVLWCCAGALHDAGWWERRGEARFGIALGMGAEQLMVWEGDVMAGGRRIWEEHLTGESLIDRVRRRLGLMGGPSAAVSAACASGNYALSQARQWLELGWADVCLAGGCDMGVTSISLAGFGNLRALSRRNADPATASRPFDRDRDGFVMGEGGAAFLLEPAATARRRSARVYAELAGFGASSDAYHMVIPSPDPLPAVAAMRQALADARVAPDKVDYLNAHATSTPVGDSAEAKVLAMVFGDALPRVPVSSTKSMTGHLLTAAAAVEALACVAAMQRQALPPTINLDNPDPECAICHVANEARPGKVRVAVSNSFGFGGSNTCLVLKAV
jgi:3-oxoacyl-[acyl-carrier-protein] synthase II